MTTPITFILADDDPVFRELVLQYLQLVPNCECLAACDNAIEANLQLQKKFPDILILDVEMPGLTGMQFAKSLTQLPLIIFISSHPNYAAEAFDVDAIDFLVKPVLPERLMRAMEKARALVEMKNSIKTPEGFNNSTDLSFFLKDKNS
jgi:two-component SAPR family response regulator